MWIIKHVFLCILFVNFLTDRGSAGERVCENVRGVRQMDGILVGIRVPDGQISISFD